MAYTRLSVELRLLTALLIGDDEQGQAALRAGSAISWERFDRLAHGNGVAGLAAARLVQLKAARPDLAQIGSDLVADWSELRAECAALHLVQSAWACRLTRMIEAAGAPVLVVKGVALAETYYPQAPHLRSASDIDLLISPDDLFQVDAVLRAGGLVRRWPANLPEPRSRDMFLLLANVFEYVDPASGQLIELHHRLTLNPAWTPSDFASLYGNSAELQLPQGSIRAITGPDHLLYLCGHAFSHTAYRLKWFCDIAAVLRDTGSGSASLGVRPLAASVPVELTDAVLDHLRAEIEGRAAPAARPAVARKVAQVIADMENPVDIMETRTFSGLPAELRFRWFLMRASPGWCGKLFEVLRALADPRDATVIGLDRRFAFVYALAGPALAMRRLLARRSRS